MGIKYLHNIIKTKCADSIQTIRFKDLYNKTIIIDISIYLFKFAYDGNLIDHFYILFTLLKRYEVNPIFVFDGKPPDEKKKLLIERKLARMQTENDLNDLEFKLLECINNKEKKDIICQIEMLKKKIVNLTVNDFERVKELIDAFGFDYITADGEADEVCAYYVVNNKAWACLSDDTDMFLYGCPRVLRQLNLFEESVLLYVQSDILNEFDLTQEEFNELCIYSGTDYNVNNVDKNRLNILFQRYINEKQLGINNDISLWINENKHLLCTDTMENTDYDKIKEIKNMFNLHDKTNLHKYDFMNIPCNTRRQMDINKIKLILRNNGFILVE